MKLHRWGAQFGGVSAVWWDLWARRPCWQFTRRARVIPTSSCGHQECTPSVCEWI